MVDGVYYACSEMVSWLAKCCGVAATNVGHPANKQNERMLMFVAKHGNDSKEDSITCATIVQPCLMASFTQASGYRLHTHYI